MIQPLLLATGFLTRLPVRSHCHEPAQLAHSMPFFPWVGLLVGALLAALGAGLAHYLPAFLAATLVVACGALLTGALHLDGLADTFDALGGGAGNPARMLEIMRDSRIGAHGACALGLVLAGKVIAVGELLQRQQVWPLLAAPVIARWAVLPLMVGISYARPSGLGRAFADHGRAWHVTAALLPVIGITVWLGPTTMALPTFLALAAAGSTGAWLRWRLGGLTGDVYGAAIELAELLFWVGALARVQI